MRVQLIQLKIADPHMKFRLELNLNRDVVSTKEKVESGLEAPESFFVELSAYQDEYGEADAKEIVFETVEGVMTAGAPLPLHIRDGEAA